MINILIQCFEQVQFLSNDSVEGRQAFVTWRASTNRRHDKSHISGEIYSTSEGSFEVQIKLPKPVLTYVLSQC